MTSHHEEPAFLDDEGPSNDLPAFISTTNARELYGLREGETVAEAITRHQGEGSEVSRLTPDELAELRRDMAESSAWMRSAMSSRSRVLLARRSSLVTVTTSPGRK